MSDQEKKPKTNISPEMRRGVSRRSLITDELGKASLEAFKKLPHFAPILGFALKESSSRRDARLVTNLWQLLMGREPKPEEKDASLEVMRKAATPEEKADALVDVLWALCQTKDFEDLARPNRVLIRGVYRIALDRDPTDQERDAALGILDEAAEPAAKAGGLEGLFTGLLRSAESVFRKDSSPSPLGW